MLPRVLCIVDESNDSPRVCKTDWASTPSRRSVSLVIDCYSSRLDRAQSSKHNHTLLVLRQKLVVKRKVWLWCGERKRVCMLLYGTVSAMQRFMISIVRMDSRRVMELSDFIHWLRSYIHGKPRSPYNVHIRVAHESWWRSFTSSWRWKRRSGRICTPYRTKLAWLESATMWLSDGALFHRRNYSVLKLGEEDGNEKGFLC